MAARIRLPRFWSGPASCACPRGAEGHLEVQFALEAFRGLWHEGEHLQPAGEVTDCFHLSKAFKSALPSLLPVGNSLRQETRLGIVLGQQLGLRLADRGKMRL